MTIKRFMISGATAATILALAAFPALAAVGNQNPNLTVQLNLNPTVVTAPNQVTATGSITNNTRKTDRVTAEVEITSPSGAASSYYQKYTIGAGQTVSQTNVYSVSADAERGTYTIVLSATDKAGTSSATEYLTVQ